jgi:hypothetical protein
LGVELRLDTHFLHRSFNIEELQDKYNKEFDFVITYFNVKSKDFYIDWKDKARISGYITDEKGVAIKCDDYPLCGSNEGILNARKYFVFATSPTKNSPRKL